MATWPASLPQRPNADGFREQKVDILLRSPMDAGPPKVRPLYRSAPTDLALPFILTTAQRATLETFYDTTLGLGTLPFDWIHPVTDAAVSMMFTARPGYSPFAPGYWTTMVQTRIWP